MKEKEKIGKLKAGRKHPWLAFVFLVVGLLWLILGLISGEYWSVVEKAITVCLDCLGIG